MLKSPISISFLLFLIGSSQSLRAQDQEAKVGNIVEAESSECRGSAEIRLLLLRRAEPEGSRKIRCRL